MQNPAPFATTFVSSQTRPSCHTPFAFLLPTNKPLASGTTIPLLLLLLPLRQPLSQHVFQVGNFTASIIIIFAFVAGVHCVQRFEQQPSYTEVNPHQDALLVCKVFNKRGSCSWQKDNKVRADHSLLFA